jgi:bifunctional non-homologous end joining protein LigD
MGRVKFHGLMPLATTTSVPRVEPIVPTARPLAFNDPAWLFEPKYDGFRGILYLTGRACMLYSKRGNAMKRFRALAEQVRAALPCREVILDGEIIATDDDDRISFLGSDAKSRNPSLRSLRPALA